jgi:DNA-binding Xre family transcriptional regulator
MGVNLTAETPVSLHRNNSMNSIQGDAFAEVSISGSTTQKVRSGKVVGPREMEVNSTAETLVSLHHDNSMNSIQGDKFAEVGISVSTTQKARSGKVVGAQ